MNCLSHRGVASGQNEGFDTKYSARVPRGLIAKVDQKSGVVLYFSSDASSYANGQSILVDDGWTAW